MSNYLFSLKELAGVVTGLVTHSGDLSPSLSGLTFDSRKVRHPAQELFVALSGGNRDGHAFLADAWAKGVRSFLVEKTESLPVGAHFLQVSDSRRALQEIAAHHRTKFTAPVIAITGSNGKTIVKEWLASILAQKFAVAKSPESYNSQIGVPLSLLELRPDTELALIEAGISLPGEMARLQAMIRPEFGIMTHFGDAHAEGFASEAEKLAEKMRLFAGCKLVFVTADDPAVRKALAAHNLPVRTVGRSSAADLRLLQAEEIGEAYTFTLFDSAESPPLELPMSDFGSLENALLAVLVARHFGLSWEEIAEELSRLHPVSMRTELITDNPEVAIINDAYNADRASTQNALLMLADERVHPGRAVILSDLEHQGDHQLRLQQDLLQLARQRFGSGNIILVGPVFFDLARTDDGLRAYRDVDDFLAEFNYEQFRNKTVLLKGARRFALERIIPYLSRRVTATQFKINLDDLVHNYRVYRQRVGPEVRITAMVKAFSYGSGTWEIARELARQGVDYLAVAYISEGIALRTRGIETPIMILNADAQNIRQLFHFRLEPMAYSLEFLREYARAGEVAGVEQFPVHLEFDSGMRRLGFVREDLPELMTALREDPRLQIKSVLSHFAAADEPERDGLSRAQFQRFAEFFGELAELGDSPPWRHICNTAGIERFPEYHLDMVRLGIGLYGISPVAGSELELREIGTLESVVTQVHAYPAGTPIGYGASEITAQAAQIATVPIGYADGIRRHLSNGRGRFLVRGQRAPVIGRVCMDMLMLDVTKIKGVVAGDRVTLLGGSETDAVSVREVAELCGTIPYEILTGISQRVRRVYVRE
ncbi:MAG: bifunctional UDP-N-acetylmuramoyl-tripeptide:D-alanyl-D-alanine ligase/alanine racemase [Bacteroidota bacterium]